MFTKQELNVLRWALRMWKGPFHKATTTSQGGLAQKDALECADNLATRFEDILEHYHEMENSHLP